MTDIKLKDITPPRGMLMGFKESKEYTKNKIQELKEEGKITEEEEKYLIECWCSL